SERCLLGGLQPDRCAFADQVGELERSLAMPAEGMHLLHEAAAIRLLSAEFVAQQEVVHRIAPAGAGEVTIVRAAQRGDTALRFELREAGRVSGDDDVAREHHLDADRVGDSVHDRNQRLAAALLHAEGIERALEEGASAAGLASDTTKPPTYANMVR